MKFCQGGDAVRVKYCIVEVKILGKDLRTLDLSVVCVSGVVME